MRTVNKQRLVKAENEIQRIMDDLFKQERGLESVNPKVIIHLHSGNRVHDKVFDKLDYPISSTGSKILSSSEPYYSSNLIIYVSKK
jgi:hypothetical protein